MFPQQRRGDQRQQSSTDLSLDLAYPQPFLGSGADDIRKHSNQIFDLSARRLDQPGSIGMGNYDPVTDLHVSLGPPAPDHPSYLAPSLACAPLQVNQDHGLNVLSEQQLQDLNYLSDDLGCFGDTPSVVQPIYSNHSLEIGLTESPAIHQNLSYDASQLFQYEASPPIERPLGNSLDGVWLDPIEPNDGTAVNKLDMDKSMQKIMPSTQLVNPLLKRGPPSHAKEDHVGPQQYRTLVPLRRKILRKKGRACLLCGQEKVKVS